MYTLAQRLVASGRLHKRSLWQQGER